MEHSKLPFRYRSDNATEATYWDIEDANRRKIATTFKSIKNAKFIVTACNSYYDNKRKADAYDKLVAELKHCHDRCGLQTTEDLLKELGEL